MTQTSDERGICAACGAIMSRLGAGAQLPQHKRPWTETPCLNDGILHPLPWAAPPSHSVNTVHYNGGNGGSSVIAFGGGGGSSGGITVNQAEWYPDPMTGGHAESAWAKAMKRWLETGALDALTELDQIDACTLTAADWAWNDPEPRPVAELPAVAPAKPWNVPLVVTCLAILIGAVIGSLWLPGFWWPLS